MAKGVLRELLAVKVARSPKVVSIPPIAQALNRRPFGSSAASQPSGRKAPLFAVEISSTLGNSVQGLQRIHP